MASTKEGPRVDPEVLRALPLRAHDLLADVPLHDAWRFQLEGGPADVTVRQVVDLLVRQGPTRVGRAGGFLFALRRGLGRLFRWDRPDASMASRSYVQRLSEDDRRRSLDEPGLQHGSWTVVYSFEREALGEVINRTVHAFLLFALEPATGGHTLYWGVYVKPVGWFSSVYLALINPFRRWIIYPAIVRRFERAWRARWGGDQ